MCFSFVPLDVHVSRGDTVGPMDCRIVDLYVWKQLCVASSKSSGKHLTGISYVVAVAMQRGEN